MTNKSSISSDINRLLKSNTLMTISELSRCLRRARSTLFKDLQSLSTVASYTHAGKYHSLSSTPLFGTNGLWFYEDIGFSKQGTLKATVIQLVESSTIGHTHKELNNLLKIKSHNTLKNLVESNHISRRQMPNALLVYLHRNNDKAEQQYSVRLSMNTKPLAKIFPPPPQWMAIEVLAEVIRCHDVEAHANTIFQRLHQRGVDIKANTVEQVFTYYQVKKKQI